MEGKCMKKLGKDGQRLWKDVSGRFDVTGCEPLLTELCTVADRLAQVRAAIAVEGVTAKNRLLGVELRLVDQFTKVWRTLGLADLPPVERRPAGRPTEVERIRRNAS
jgi:hypothetical protein